MYYLLPSLFLVCLLISSPHGGGDRGTPNRDKVLTVIVPCWRCERWLNDTLAAIHAQTIAPAIDVLVVDDGGRLDAAAFAPTTAFTVIRHSTNRGLSAARNSGAKAARTPFIVFLDPDDVISPACLERLLLFHICAQSRQRVRPIAWTFPSVTHVDQDLGVLYRSGERFSEAVFQSTPHPHQPPSFAILNRQVYLQAGGQCGRVRWWEDLEFFHRLYRHHGLAGQWWPDPDLFFYRRHPASRSAHVLKATSEEAARAEALHQSTNCVQAPAFSLPPSHKYHYLQTKSRLPVDVLFVVPWLDRGGADDYDLHVIRVLRAHNLTVAVVTTDAQALLHNHQEARYRRHTADLWHLGLLNIADRDSVDLTDHVFDSWRPRAVWVRNSMAGYRMARRYAHRATFLDIQHLDCPTDRLGFEHTSRPYRGQLAARVVVSRRLQRITPNATLIYPPVEKAFWRCPGGGAGRDAHLVLFVGRLVEQKQPARFVQLCNQLDHRFTCKLIGDLEGGGAGGFGARSPRIRVSGWLDKDALRQEMCAATFLVLTSQNEGVPMTALQAASCGMQVIALDVGAVGEIPGVRLAGSVPEIASIINGAKAGGHPADIANIPDFPDLPDFDRSIVGLFKELMVIQS